MGENYKRIKVLGEGAFGKCYLAECTNTQVKFAIKEIDIRQMTTAEKDEALKEAKILERLQHPNIIRFHEVYRTKNGKLCIVMDYADGGDLADKIKSQRGKLFTEREVLDLFVQLCLALKHVHDRKILHRDIKSQNVFLSGSSRVKLGDFGIARVLRNTVEKARTMVGTPYYLSPEIIESKPYNFKSDIWSLGVMLYEICALKPPFDASSLHLLAMKIVRGNYSPVAPHYSRDLKGLVSQMLTVDPNRRPSINQILRLPFIKEKIKAFLTETVQHQEFSHTVLHSQDVFRPTQPPSELPRRDLPAGRDVQRPRQLPQRDVPKDPVRELPRDLPREFQLIEAQRERDRQEAVRDRERIDAQREYDRDAQRVRELAAKERERLEAQRDRDRQERDKIEAQKAVAAQERERLERFRQDQARAKAEAAKAEAAKVEAAVKARLDQLRAEPRPLVDPLPHTDARRDEPKTGGVGFFVEFDKPKKDKSVKAKVEVESERRRREQKEADKIRRGQDHELTREERLQLREEERQHMMKDIKKKMKKKPSKKKAPVELISSTPPLDEADEVRALYIKEKYQPNEDLELKPYAAEVKYGQPNSKADLSATHHESERRRMLDEIRRRKKELQQQKEEVKIEIFYPGMSREREDEAFALELQEALLVGEEDEIPEELPQEDLSIVEEIGEDREDFDPEFEDETASKNMHDRLESMRQYLSEQLGEEPLMAFYNVVKDNDREDLFEFPYERYFQSLAGLLSEEKVREYSPLIHTLVFLENESFAS